MKNIIYYLLFSVFFINKNRNSNNNEKNNQSHFLYTVSFCDNDKKRINLYFYVTFYVTVTTKQLIMNHRTVFIIAGTAWTACPVLPERQDDSTGRS